MENFPEHKNLTKDDYVIVLADFGYWNNSISNRYWMSWMNKRPFTTLFIAGNYENYDVLKQLPVEEWNGGKIQYIRNSVIHLMRGEIYNIGGKKFLYIRWSKESRHFGWHIRIR